MAGKKSNIPAIYRTKNLASTMTLGVVASAGEVMPTHFFAKGEKVNAAMYMKVLEDKVIPWMKEVADRREFLFEQDSAPAHMAKKTLDLLTQHSIKFWDPQTWPSNSPA